MKAKDLFTIILKIFGIYLIKDVLFSIPPVLYEILQVFCVSKEMAFISLVVSLLKTGIYIWIVYMLLFKTNFLISKLDLTSNLSEEPLIVNLHRSSIYTIAIIVSGILILTFAIPGLVKQLYFLYEYNNSRDRLFNVNTFEYSNLLTAISEAIIGLLFLGNQKALVNYIEMRRRDAKNSDPL